MKKTILYPALFFACFPLTAQPDSAALAKLGRTLDSYMMAIEREPAKVKTEESDFLIYSCKDSITAQYTALKVYDHYLNSPVMGDDAVAVHICDNWFIPGKIKMKSDLDLMNARIFAEFNRQSLIGKKAPELEMADVSGNTVRLFTPEWKGERPAVLYFYDVNCAKCKVESILLRNFIADIKYEIDFYAIYTQSDRKQWEEYIRNGLNTVSDYNADGQSTGSGRLRHLWDPDVDSDYQMKYGVIQTPRMFLISKEGIILGRGLDTYALGQLTDILFKPSSETKLEYGNEKIMSFYDRVFEGFGKNISLSDIDRITESIREKTLDNKDTVLFRQMTGDLVFYLGSRRGEAQKLALGKIIRNEVFGRPSVWANSHDSLAILPYATMLDDLLGKSEIGKKLPQVTVDAEYRKGDEVRTGHYRLDRLRDATVIFHTDGCDICKAEIEASVRAAAGNRKARFYYVNMDQVLAERPDIAKRLFDNFDLTVLPYITVTGRSGKVVRKYVSLSADQDLHR